MSALKDLQGPPLNTDYPEGGLGCMIYEACNRFTEKICHVSPNVVNPHEEWAETFGSFKDRSSRVAQEMLKRGIKPKDTIVNCCPNNFDNALTTAASLYIGAIPSTMDPTMSDRDCRHLLKLIEPRIIFVHELSVELMEKAVNLSGLSTDIQPDIVVYGNSTKYLTFSNFLETSASDFRPIPQTNLDTTAIMLFSSGSTGLAKSICTTHRNLFAGAISFLDLLDDPSCMMHYTTFYWISAVLIFISQFVRGSCRIGARAFDEEEPFKTVSKHKVTATFMASSYAYQLQPQNLSILRKKYDISSLKSITLAGGPVSEDQMKRVRSWFPGVSVFLGYGMSEAGAFLTGFNAFERRKYINHPGSSGRPVRATTIRFVDPETEKVLGPNQQGELRYKLISRFNGYYRQPDEEIYDSQGYFKSGDLGYYDEEGLIYICDRIKDMFKYMSWHIIPVALELIVNEHPDVAESIVFGVPDEVAENLPAAAVVLKDGHQVRPEDIKRFVAERVIDRQQLRGGVFIVDKLFKTPSGKIQRRKMKELLLSRFKSR